MATDETTKPSPPRRNTLNNKEWFDLDQEYRLQSRYTSPIVLERGKGTRLWDVEGTEYIDFHSGQVCANTGHCHPELVEAVTEQVRTLMQTGSMFTDMPQVLLAKKLAEITPEPLHKSFFACSGSEAIEASLRAAKLYTGGFEIMGILRSYHGMTMGAYSLSAGPSFKKAGYGYAVAGINHFPPPYCYRCDFNQTYPGCGLECLQYGFKIVNYATTGSPAAVVVEPLVSGGGVYMPPVEWMQELRDYCTEHGILLIADECQTGIGRTGEWFAFQHFDIVPDIVVVSKGLGGGIPLSGIIVTRDVAAGLEAKGYQQTSSHTGDPMLAAGGLANIELIERHNLLQNVRDMGAYLKDGLQQFVKKYDIIGDARGIGMLQGLEFVTDKKSRTPDPESSVEVSRRCTMNGLFIGAPSGSNNCMRILPPFVVSKQDIDIALDILERAIDGVAKGRPPESMGKTRQLTHAVG
jgi:4-aminobutyrate aminotransferase-like enzyme